MAKRNTFTSYLNECSKSICQNNEVQHMKLLDGELQIASEPSILHSPTAKIHTNLENVGIEGILIITNFRLCFSERSSDNNGPYLENILLRRYDVTLSNIDIIYQIVDKKRKKLIPQQKISSKSEALYIICKNFRTFKFSFKTKEAGKNIAHSLVLFANPNRPDLSFGNIYRESYYNTTKSSVTMFNSKNDWSRELIRCGATDWRVISSESVRSSDLPKHFVIPKTIELNKFEDLCSRFCDSRICFWSYSFGKAALLRIGEVKCIEDSHINNETMEKIRLNDPEKKPLSVFNLYDLLPTIEDVNRGYLKLRELCTPYSTSQFFLQESKYLLLMEKTNWLLYVSLSIKESVRAAKEMRNGITVVLQENNARDLCCVISSLIQIILDPYFRTIDGFQSLIQKEWIALEHQFKDRLGHIYNTDNESKTSPIFLLFLDCVWQLLKQCPFDFEFSEIYLTNLWDSVFIPIFDTFQFNSEKERQCSVKENKLILRPIWDWGEQFADKEKVFFFNPFYSKQDNFSKGRCSSVSLSKSSSTSRISKNYSHHINQDNIPKDEFLDLKWDISSLEIWQLCYYRWLPLIEINCGGYSQIDIFNRILTNNIYQLQKNIQTEQYDTENEYSVSLRKKNTDFEFDGTVGINSFFPFSTSYGNIELNEILVNFTEQSLNGSIIEQAEL